MPTPEELEVIRIHRQRRHRNKMWRSRPIVSAPLTAPARFVNGMFTENRIGSMDAGSNTLTITSEAYANDKFSMFEVGDPIIVATGGEAGAGLFGTVGVGGVFTATPDGNYYNSQQNPIALRTTVVTVSSDGKILTLADSAVVATIDAEVWFNNQPLIQAMHSESHAPGHTVTYPTGTFAIGDAIGVTGGSVDWILNGAGKGVTNFKWPKGCTGTFFTFQSHGVEISDFSIIGNVADESFGRNSNEYQAGIIVIATTDAFVHDCAIHNVFQKAVWAQGGGSNDIVVTDCDVILQVPYRNYLSQWFFGVNDSVGGTFTRCNVNSNFIQTGYETFRSSGVKFIDCVSRNGVVSSNSSGSFEFTRFNITIEALSQPLGPGDSVYHHLSPAVNINSNIQPPDASMLLGGIITDMVLTIEGYMNTNNEVHKGVVINVDNPNITINGGIVTYTSPALVGKENGCAGLNSTGENTVVNDLTVVGNSRDAFDFNIAVQDGSVTNCTAALINCVGPNCVLTP